MIRDALIVAGKDLRIELRSKVTATQVVPFALIILALFAFALDTAVIRDPNSSLSVPKDAVTAAIITAGLFWLATLFSMLLAVQRSFAIETADGGRDGLRLSTLDPGGIFLGKAAAVAVQMLVLEVILGAGAVLFFNAEISNPFLLTVTCVVATVGLAALGTCHGALTAGMRVRDSLLPLLFFPVAAPVLLGAVRATQGALSNDTASSWTWVQLLGSFAVLFTGFGIAAFGAIMEDA
jgi:heme exporter protein B